MKIDKLQVKDFQGLAGTREFEFPDKITVFAMPNGTGKTSVLNAIRFGITGDTQKKMVISGNAEKCDVGITLSNGTNVIREVSRKGPSKQWLDRRPIDKKGIERAILASDALNDGVSLSDVKIVTASELIGNMKPQDLSDFMLAFIPESLSADTVISYIPDLSDDAKSKIRRYFPEQFGIEEVEKFYDHCYERRKEVKRQKAEADAVLKMYKDCEMPEESKDELKAIFKEIKAYEKEQTEYNVLLDSYNRAVEAAKQQEKSLKALEEEYERLKDSVFDQKITDDLNEKLNIRQKELDEAKRLAMSFRSAADSLKKALETLDRPICPLSEKLVCTTDKSPIRNELQASFESSDKEAELQQEKIKTLVEEIGKLQISVSEQEKLRADSARKEDLKKQIETLKKAIKAAKPSKPKQPKKRDLPSEDEIRKKAELVIACEKRDTWQQALAGIEQSLADYELLVSAFGPKGVVKNTVISEYFHAFEESCNEKAEKLRPGMRMKFRFENGVVPYLDVHGDGMYFPYPALSGGEKIYLVFLLLDALGSMTNIRMLFLDELSILDSKNFEALLDVLTSNTDDYDQVFLTMVDHEPLLKALSDKGIKVTAL